jgi:protease IV
MSRKSDWIIGGVLIVSVFVFLLFFGLVVFGVLLNSEGSFSYTGQRIALIEINGPITNARGTVKQIIKYREDDSVSAIVLRVDSPGGVVAPTQEIFEELRKTRETGKIIVASMGSIAASGGYYIACAADSIVANPGTLTGSIGVIFELPNAEGLMEKLGVNWEVIKSGRHKDIGSLARSMTDEEVRLMQTVVDDVYNQFVDVVTAYRPLSRTKVIELADGRIYTGNQAQPLHLVDRLGTYEDAIALAAEMAGITGKPNIVSERAKTFIELLMENLDSKAGVRSSGIIEYRYQ